MKFVVQAITTKYLAPTDKRDSRIVASCQAGRITVPWKSGKGIEENHAEAARALAVKLNWYGDWHQGGVSDGYVFVCTMPYGVAESAFRITAEQEIAA